MYALLTRTILIRRSNRTAQVGQRDLASDHAYYVVSFVTPPEASRRLTRITSSSAIVVAVVLFFRFRQTSSMLVAQY